MATLYGSETSAWTQVPSFSSSHATNISIKSQCGLGSRKIDICRILPLDRKRLVESLGKIVRLGSPFFYQLCQYSIQGDTLILVEESCEGTKLEEYVRKRIESKPLEEFALTEWLINLIFCLMRLESQRVTINEFKLQNIIVTQNVRLKIDIASVILQEFMGERRGVEIEHGHSLNLTPLNIVGRTIFSICTLMSNEPRRCSIEGIVKGKILEPKKRIFENYSKEFNEIAQFLLKPNNSKVSLEKFLRIELINNHMNSLVQSSKEEDNIQDMSLSRQIFPIIKIIPVEGSPSLGSLPDKCKTEGDSPKKQSKFVNKLKQAISRNIDEEETKTKASLFDLREADISDRVICCHTETEEDLSDQDRSFGCVSAIEIGSHHPSNQVDQLIKSCQKLVKQKQFIQTQNFIKQCKQNKRESQIESFLNKKYASKNPDFLVAILKVIPYL